MLWMAFGEQAFVESAPPAAYVMLTTAFDSKRGRENMMPDDHHPNHACHLYAWG